MEWLKGADGSSPVDLEAIVDAKVLDYQNTGKTFVPYEWSHALALSAGKHVEELAGCNVYPEMIIDQGSAKEELDKFAKYDNHTRVYHFPERMYWTDEEELVFDLFFDGYHLGMQNNDIFFNNYYDQIGMACNCHHDFGYFCVFEFGKGVEIRDFEYDHVHSIHEQGDMIWDHEHRTQLPEML